MKKIKIALLGASSKTGIEFISQANSHPFLEVHAFVRNPEKIQKALSIIPSNLFIHRFDVNGSSEWQKQLKECTIWVSIVGIAGLLAARKPGDLYKNTALLLTSLAAQYQPERVLVVTSGGVVESDGEPWILKQVLKPYFLNPMYADMREMERIIQESEMNFTIVRPPYLTNGKKKEKYRIIINDWFKDDKVLSRKDLAHFLLNASIQLDPSFNKTIVGISY